MILTEFGPETASETGCEGGPTDLFASLAREGLQAAVPNVSALMGMVTTDVHRIPFLVSTHGGGPCYLASFTRTYIDGAAQVLARSDRLSLKALAPGLFLAGPLLRALAMDDLVIVNANLFPTCAADDWADLDVTAMIEAMTRRYPAHAIWVRGLTDRLHGRLLERLATEGFVVTPSRPVEIFDPAPPWQATRQLRTDFNRLGRLRGLRPFVGGPFLDADFEAMERLCRLATVDPHGPLMPQYTAVFFEACAAWPACRTVGLREPSGALRAFANLIVGRDMIACGTIGYDAGDEQAKGVYPALNALAMRQAAELCLPFNIGYGAARFKRARGAEAAMEMGAFYISHLPRCRRVPWRAVLGAMELAAGPITRRL